MVPAAGWGPIVASCAFRELPHAQPQAPRRRQAISAGRSCPRVAWFPRDGPTGSAWGDYAPVTGFPLRTFVDELGVQDLVGFWDPAGLAAEAVMRMRRVSFLSRVSGRRRAGCLHSSFTRSVYPVFYAIHPVYLVRSRSLSGSSRSSVSSSTRSVYPVRSRSLSGLPWTPRHAAWPSHRRAQAGR